MVIIQGRAHKKPTGGRLLDYRKRRQYDMGSLPINTKLGEPLRKTFRGKGGVLKVKQASSNLANVTDPKTKKTVVAKILTVKDNPANRNFVRRNIITKGTIIETEKGKARVTSRPGQEGSINAVLVH
jgi:small subunit ribosomal protein S8e